MEHRSHFRRQESEHEQHAAEGATASAGQTSATGVSSVEEVVLLDRAQIAVPARVTERLAKSIAAEPAPIRPWWKRWLGK